MGVIWFRAYCISQIRLPGISPSCKTQPELFILRFQCVLKWQSSFIWGRRGTKQNKRFYIFPCPNVPSPRASRRETCLAARPSVFLFTRRTQSESMPLGIPAPRWLSSAWSRSGIQWGRSGATQRWWRHTSHLHPQGHKPAFSGSRGGRPGARATIMFERSPVDAVQYREIKTNALQAELNFLMLVSALSLHFFHFSLSCFSL